MKGSLTHARRHAGFTLLEVMLAATVSVLILLMLGQLLGTLLGTWTRGTDRSETRAAARLAMDLLGRELAAAYVDLDLGWQLIPAANGSHDPQLKLLTRRHPNNPHNSSIYRVDYRLGWSARTLGGQVGYDNRFREVYAPSHDIPVLIRTASSDISPVFNALPPRTAQTWVQEWPNPSNPFAPANGSVESVVDYVLGWKIELLEWSEANNAFVLRPADATAPAGFDRLRTSEEDVRVLQITLALIGPSSVPLLTSFPEFANVRSRSDLFTMLNDNGAPTDVFGRLLVQHLRLITSTVRLESKTP